MKLLLKWLKQFKCRFIKRTCGNEVVGERYEKPQRKLYFRCEKCDRIISRYV